LDEQQRLLRRAMRIGNQQSELLKIGAARGLDADQLMNPVKGIYDAFVARTAPSSWWEGLLRPMVTHTITRDFVLILASALPSAERAQFEKILADDDPDDSIGPDIIRHGTSGNQVLNSRLSLWGRRVAGEALQICADAVHANPALADLLMRATATAMLEDNGATRPVLNIADALLWLRRELEHRHASRMEAIGLVP
jgi:hypothetical protein